MARKRVKVTLSIDAEVWSRCHQWRDRAGLNWSRIAEEAFSVTMHQLETVQQLLDDNPGAAPQLLKAQLKQYVTSALSEAIKEIDESDRQ